MTLHRPSLPCPVRPNLKPDGGARAVSVLKFHGPCEFADRPGASEIVATGAPVPGRAFAVEAVDSAAPDGATTATCEVELSTVGAPPCLQLAKSGNAKSRAVFILTISSQAIVIVNHAPTYNCDTPCVVEESSAAPLRNTDEPGAVHRGCKTIRTCL